ncbi:uroporphyrinogen-III C-methyltransferase [Alicyclobacillus fastidiosus]|uniref:uroporphyrinogen-III C-methyltransferase n=1 Tax=Alicyclobacillus fastidiosus TaxID=392011 RepID=A0ABY6ZLD9_9BACL|nr:uroporphyrinogen-III C-methyltransferase [Alicyclobacillus fastidiosus]WAH42755.1 uroporphyrinogen-III C-methyltransferase [Alicyclobacillus fastidiosus]GMA64667.1 hypothetical protein GCM10025859_51070 [Alicyclobacillus fastidiosus]
MASGRVFLVGAGPGDPGLLTVKGRRVLEHADAIVYDRLASPRLLGYAKPGVSLYYVGKVADDHTMPQRDIEQLLISLARAGRNVVRLKGGDPFVFGRGGEEALALAKADIPFEVVPGITSAVSVPAYAGIPVTYRDVSPSFTVVTGHRSTEGLELDWNAYAKLSDTLVVLMGVRQLPRIVAGLLTAGKSPTTPVALIRWGTRAAQRTLVGTLEDIAETVRQTRFQSPAIIVVGDVVSSRDELSWFESLPLFGRRVFITADTTAEAIRMAEALEVLGAETLAFSSELIASQNTSEIRCALSDVMTSGVPAGVYFTTTLGAKCWFDELRVSRIDARRLSSLSFGASNHVVAEYLETYGIFADGIGPDTLLQSPVEQWWCEAGGNLAQAFGNLSVAPFNTFCAYAVDENRPWSGVFREWLAEGVDVVWTAHRSDAVEQLSLEACQAGAPIRLQSLHYADDSSISQTMIEALWNDHPADSTVVRV